MADHGTLQAGDTVTHPEWPEGSTARVIGHSYFQRANARGRVREDKNVRIIHLDRPMTGEDGDTDHAWMELGLVRVPEA